MADSVKPKTARKTAVWKLRREYVSSVNAATQKSTDKLTNNKETKVNVRAVKNLNTVTKLADAQKTIAVRPTAVRTVKADDKPSKVVSVQPTFVHTHTVIQDQKMLQKSPNTPAKANETHQLISVPTIAAVEKGRAIVRTTDLKTATAKTTVARTMRPSIIKKTIIKEGVPVSSVAATTVVRTTFCVE